MCRWRGLASKGPHRFLVALTPARPRYASQLPRAEPRGESRSIGWSLVVLAAVLERFEDTHEFILATPDGRVPTLDINGLALAMEGGKDLGLQTAAITVQQGVGKSGPAQLRDKHPELVARRESELALLRRHLGRMPVLQNLPNTDAEAASNRDEVVATLDGLPEQRWHLIADVIARYRSLSDAFSLADLDFMYAPGGHAPMVDFHDNPVVGELLHALRENDVPVGLICHAPVAMTSAKYRLGQDEDGGTLVGEDHAFRGARVTTVPKYGEIGMLTFGYPTVPGTKTRLPYYVDVALKEAGYDVLVTLNPSAVGVLWDEEHGLLTGNGPQSVDAQARKLAEIAAEARSGRSGRAPRCPLPAMCHEHREAAGSDHEPQDVGYRDALCRPVAVCDRGSHCSASSAGVAVRRMIRAPA